MDSFNRRDIGKLAENEACRYLQDRGLRLLRRNYQCYYGEIDLIMQDLDTIVFVEVRKRTYIQYGNACESIGKNKIKRIIKTATHFLQVRRWLHKVQSRFDVIAIHPVAGKMQLEWIKNAFTVGG